jgi:phosphoribosylformylglycinamidine synthase
MLAVAEAARNVACAGALPIGATNCLNFGNPERPEIMWQFAEAVDGIAEACRALDIPITGGNVSLYNETDGQAIYPTPILGVVGLVEDASRVLARTFRHPGADIVLFGRGRAELGASEYLKCTQGLVAGEPPHLDLAAERALVTLLVRAAADGLLQSAHDCSDGGIAVALAECSFDTAGLGFAVELPEEQPLGAGAADAVAGTLFGESATRAVASVLPDHREAVMALAAEIGVPARVIGRTGGDRLRFTVGETLAIDCSVAEAENVWATALGQRFAGRAA